MQTPADPTLETLQYTEKITDNDAVKGLMILEVNPRR